MGTCRSLGHGELCRCRLSRVVGDLTIADSFLSILDELDRLSEKELFRFPLMGELTAEKGKFRVTQLLVARDSQTWWRTVIWLGFEAGFNLAKPEQQISSPENWTAMRDSCGNWLVEHKDQKVLIEAHISVKDDYAFIANVKAVNMSAAFACDLGMHIADTKWLLGHFYFIDLAEAVRAWLRKEDGSTRRLKEIVRELDREAQK